MDHGKPVSDSRTEEIINEEHLKHIHTEFKDGFEFLKKYPKSVTIFGSSRSLPGEEMYRLAEEVGRRIVTETGYAVITGGGPGIMEAANKGAYEAKGSSIGLNISLPHEWTTNPYVTHSIQFTYFFSRKTMLIFAAEAYVFFPGGYGTLDELGDLLVLIQTGKIPVVPIILFGSSFWQGYVDFLNTVLVDNHMIAPVDLEIFEVTDSIDRIIEVTKKSTIATWWPTIN